MRFHPSIHLLGTRPPFWESRLFLPQPGKRAEPHPRGWGTGWEGNGGPSTWPQVASQGSGRPRLEKQAHGGLGARRSPAHGEGQQGKKGSSGPWRMQPGPEWT